MYKVFLQEKQARKHPEATARPCKKRVGSNIGRGHHHYPAGMVPEAGPDQIRACLEAEGQNLRCAQCQLKTFAHQKPQDLRGTGGTNVHSKEGLRSKGMSRMF